MGERVSGRCRRVDHPCDLPEKSCPLTVKISSMRRLTRTHMNSTHQVQLPLKVRPALRWHHAHGAEHALPRASHARTGMGYFPRPRGCACALQRSWQPCQGDWTNARAMLLCHTPWRESSKSGTHQCLLQSCSMPAPVAWCSKQGPPGSLRFARPRCRQNGYGAWQPQQALLCQRHVGHLKAAHPQECLCMCSSTTKHEMNSVQQNKTVHTSCPPQLKSHRSSPWKAVSLQCDLLRTLAFGHMAA